jgi:epoxyqueuosine reductase
VLTPHRHPNVIGHLAREAGFARVGIAVAGPVPRADYVESWLDRGCAGEMAYLARHRELRRDPRQLLPGAKSIIVVADPYRQAEPPDGGRASCPPLLSGGACGTKPPQEPTGSVARYAWGRDYHRVLRKKLHRFADRMHELIAEPFETRVCVDTAPLIEREWAAAAGVGWIGKNTMVLHETIGSFFFLGEIMTTLDLAASAPATDHCGTCARCLDACPTGALVAPYQMDARRCISYLTIEHRGEIAADLKPLMGDWLYGCDVCQEVCPHNHKPSPAIDPAYLPGQRNPLPPRASPPVLQSWNQDDYDRHLAGSAMRRATLDMLKRNAEIVERNQQSADEEGK